MHFRTKATKGSGSRAAGMVMPYTLIEAVQSRRRAVNAPHPVALFHKGKLAQGTRRHHPDNSSPINRQSITGPAGVWTKRRSRCPQPLSQGRASPEPDSQLAQVRIPLRSVLVLIRTDPEQGTVNKNYANHGVLKSVIGLPRVLRSCDILISGYGFTCEMCVLELDRCQHPEGTVRALAVVGVLRCTRIWRWRVRFSFPLCSVHELGLHSGPERFDCRVS